MTSTEISGRFLPSRVYNRWKWTVRCGLMLVPFLVLLSGGLILFLSPNTYRSTTLFGLENGPPPREIIELIKSRGVLDRVLDRLQLPSRFKVDKETALHIIRGATETRIVPGTRLIEVHVTLIQKIDARDVADQIPHSLRDYLVDIHRKKSQDMIGEVDPLILAAADTAAEESSTVANMDKFHGAHPADAAVIAQLERAHRVSQLADAEVERLKNLRATFLTENLESLPSINIHAAPAISNNAHSPDMDKELKTLALQSLISGLLAALLLPYLMELVFPPRQEVDIIADGGGLKMNPPEFGG